MHVTGSAEEGMHILRDNDVDLVLLDIHLPGMSGYELLRSVASQLAQLHIPVLVLSGAGSTDDIVRAFSLGAHDHIAKPFRAKELRARISSALALKRRHDDLRRENIILGSESRTDSLTGMANRRKLEADLKVLSSAARRHGYSFSVALVDVDHFKTINDRYGHPAGDRVLCVLAERLQATLRLEDIGGRWGGEEFLFLLPMTDTEGARVVGERLRSRMAEEPVILPNGEPLLVHISVGVATGLDPTDLLARADAALYRAKAAGRNLVTA